MTNEEAIIIMMNSNEYHHAKGDLPHSALSIEAFNMAIEALKERPQKTNDGILSAFADIYGKMTIQNGMVLKLVGMLHDNGLITANQAREILDLTLDQLSDPEEREKQKKELNDGTDQLIRSDAKDHEDTNPEA